LSTLSLHDALPICPQPSKKRSSLSFSNRVPCRMIHQSSRLVAITLAFAASLIFAVALILAAPVEQSPPPVTPTPEAKPSPVVVLSPAATPSKAVENSVVKIFATLRLPDPSKPWTKKEPSEITASGAVISGKRILTNAHVVQYASEVQV